MSQKAPASWDFSLPHPRPQVIESLLRDRPAGWVPKTIGMPIFSAAFHAGLQQGRKLQGSPISKWRWGHALHWTFEHPVGKQIPLVDYFFNLGPVEMSGSGTTVKQTTLSLGPSERMVVDFGDLDRSVQNLVTGESGSVASSHYKDQWPAYYVGTQFPDGVRAYRREGHAARTAGAVAIRYGYLNSDRSIASPMALYPASPGCR